MRSSVCPTDSLIEYLRTQHLLSSLQDVKKKIKDCHKELQQLTLQDLEMRSYRQGLEDAMHDIEHLAEQIQVISGIWHVVSVESVCVLLFKIN